MTLVQQHFNHGLRETPWSSPRNSTSRTAENPLPQYEQPHAPTDVDTLRQEKICPVCGSSMDEETCDICNYTEPPEPFQNPDLSKAQDSDVRMDEGPDRPLLTIRSREPEGAMEPPKVENTPRNPVQSHT
jgi:hypothetical protein